MVLAPELGVVEGARVGQNAWMAWRLRGSYARALLPAAEGGGEGKRVGAGLEEGATGSRPGEEAAAASGSGPGIGTTDEAEKECGVGCASGLQFNLH